MSDFFLSNEPTADFGIEKCRASKKLRRMLGTDIRVSGRANSVSITTALPHRHLFDFRYCRVHPGDAISGTQSNRHSSTSVTFVP